jgi:hypothetical protein
MPRYHFHIRESGRLIKDEEGQQFHDRAAVRKEALVVVDVRSEDQTCLKVSISLAVEG